MEEVQKSKLPPGSGSSLVSAGSNQVSEQPNDLALVLTNTISKKLRHVNLHKAYFLGQAWNQNSFKEDETLNTCCWEKKVSKGLISRMIQPQASASVSVFPSVKN